MNTNPPGTRTCRLGTCSISHGFWRSMCWKNRCTPRHRFVSPAPHFVVFYNGVEDAPEDVTLKLSDAFETGPGHGKEEEPSLELKVRVLNINQGYNRELMERCRTLYEYSEFVSRIRKYANQGSAIEEAVERAVAECIEEGILSDFLRSQRAEVIAVSIFEYNEEEEIEKS